jgi:hypothetical protein
MKLIKCIDCGKMFKWKWSKCIRCPECRVGKQGVPAGGAKGNPICGCGKKKHPYSTQCRECYMDMFRDDA